MNYNIKISFPFTDLQLISDVQFLIAQMKITKLRQKKLIQKHRNNKQKR